MLNSELIDAADTLAAYDPSAVARDLAMNAIARDLDLALAEAISEYMNCVKFGFALSDVRNRGRFVTFKGSDITTFYMDEFPLLEIHPIKCSMENGIITLTRNIKKLYGTQKANS